MAAMRSRTAKKHGVVTNPVHKMDGSPKLLDSRVEKPDESHGAHDALSAVSMPPDSVREMDTAKAEVGPEAEIATPENPRGVKTIQISAPVVEAMPDWMKAKILEFQKANL